LAASLSGPLYRLALAPKRVKPTDDTFYDADVCERLVENGGALVVAGVSESGVEEPTAV